MKQAITFIASIFILCAVYGQVGIGTATPNPNAILDLSATNKAFLPPRMTTAQRNAIAAPAQGMTLYNTSTDCLNFYRAGGWYDPCVALTALNERTAVNNLLGGTGSDIAWSIQQTADGGYIIAGVSTSSSSGDVTGANHGMDDYWVVKLDASGNISWSKLLGGSDIDIVRSIQQTSDGGYIVAGYSYSSASGNVTGSNHGLCDYWIVKLDASGNVSWNKLLGGSKDDYAWSAQQTSDGGYIVAGGSYSSASGDVTGINHSFNGLSSCDYWIVKLDASGNVSWNKLLGGSSVDEAHCIQQTSDGGYIVAGTSYSRPLPGMNIGNGDVTDLHHGNSDYWIVKLDASGGISWNKLFGGSDDDDAYSIQQTTDGGYVVAGSSYSSASGNITSTNHGVTDYWIVKLNASGSISWNKLLGGNNAEYAYSIKQTSDGRYIVAGSSKSSANGHVTGANHGDTDYWIVKLDAFGNISWNKLLGGKYEDLARCILQTLDGGYIVAGISRSSLSGDVTDKNAGDNNTGTFWDDAWIVRLDALGNPVK